MDVLLSEADALAARGDLATALGLYSDAALRNIPGSHERLCHATAMLDRHEEALACCTRAIKQLPTSAFLHSLEGQVGLLLGRYELSIAAYRRASELSPADADVNLNHGIALMAARQHGEAVYSLQRSVALSPSCSECYKELGRALESHANDLFASARASEAAGTWEAALRHALHSSRRGGAPGGGGGAAAVAYFGLGRSQMALGSSCAARLSYRHSTTLAPTDADSWHQRGVAARRCEREDGRMSGGSNDDGNRGGNGVRRGGKGRGLDDEARAAFERAVAIDPRRTDSWSLLLLARPSASAPGSAVAAPPPSSHPVRAAAYALDVSGHATARTLPTARGEVVDEAEGEILHRPMVSAADLTVALPAGSEQARGSDAAVAATVTAWEARAASLLRSYGVLLVTGVVRHEVSVPLAAHLRTLTKTSRTDSNGAVSATGSRRAPHDTTNTTLANVRRRHFAVSLRGAPAVEAAMAQLASSLWPILCRALSEGSADGNSGINPNAAGDGLGRVYADGSGCGTLRLIESGLLTSHPGAAAQPLHTDTAHRPSEARAYKIQLAASRVTLPMGPIEVVPGSVGLGSAPAAARDAAGEPLPFELPEGAALIYDSRAWHRGGRNRSKKKRRVFYVTVIREGENQAPPAGLPYTIEPSEVGCFVLAPPQGAVLSPTPLAAKRGECDPSADGTTVSL